MTIFKDQRLLRKGVEEKEEKKTVWEGEQTIARILFHLPKYDGFT